MAQTPQRTRFQDFLVTSGDGIRGDDSGDATTQPPLLFVQGGSTASGVGAANGQDILVIGGVPAGDNSGAGGGSVTLAGGDGSTGAAGGPGGDLFLMGGDATNAADVGGSIYLEPGAGGTPGSVLDGIVIVSGVGSAIQLDELSSVPGPTITAGQGRIWVRDDTPNVLIYTDDTGADFVLSGGAGVGSLAAVLGVGSATGGSSITFSAGDDTVFDGSGTTISGGVAFSISNTGSSNITLDTSGGTGNVVLSPGANDLVLDYATFPPADGGDGQVLTTDGAGTLAWSSAASGDVSGPGSSTDNALVRWDGAAGDTVQNSVVLVSDTGVVSGVLTVNGVTVESHSARHENGGADEIDVTGLSGLLADGQTPLTHASSHENGGGDEIDVTGLSGLLADGQTPLSHAASHQNGGADEIDVTGLSGLLADDQNAVPEDGIDTSAIHDDTAGEIAAVTAKATPTAADFLLIEDAADANNKKSITIGDLPAAATPALSAVLSAGNTTGGTAITTADGTPPNDLTLTAGSHTGTGAGATVSVTAGDGNGAGGAGGDVDVVGGDAGTTVASGGSINLTAGSGGTTSGAGGFVRLSAGPSNSGLSGSVEMTTEGNEAPVSLRTQSDFTGTTRDTFTHGSQVSINNAASSDLVVLGTLDTNSRNMTISIRATAVDNATDTNIVSYYNVISYYRSGGTVTLLGNHVPFSDRIQNNGSSLALDVYISGDDIILRGTNDTGVNGTFNIAATWDRQEGGFTS